MYDNFDWEALWVLMLSAIEARRLAAVQIGTEHLLLGIVRQKHSVAARILTSAGFTREVARKAIARTFGRGSRSTKWWNVEISFTADAKRALELAPAILQEFGDLQVDTRHLLLAVIRVDSARVERLFEDTGVELADLEESLLSRWQNS
ncbi:Clp protease N-terminal domain-containing protein [Gloeobacter violaceus]|uniref:Gll0152 protein n=1 Tax=Gloeobacter violaceus (strain ATCC 29082 / PCC 7421) TaxID=251221 RepID=Q7NPA5_GLOVI|nr:Clp protease N-terminal domain-containing protein [Gloeobacter violaceus]BAC88093.1 gll0152 [Gloeobacter violaceus PCC 7421]